MYCVIVTNVTINNQLVLTEKMSKLKRIWKGKRGDLEGVIGWVSQSQNWAQSLSIFLN